MNRRRPPLPTYLITMFAASLAGAAPSPGGAGPIQLHMDLDVEPSREERLVSDFHSVFVPAVRKQPGFLDVNLLKLRAALQGSAPPNAPYRITLRFRTEEERRNWIASDAHERAIAQIEKSLRGQKLTAILYDVR